MRDKDYDPMNTNKLFATFCTKESLEEIILIIEKKYTILFNKIFILESPESQEYICTYNIDAGNINDILSDTILMHRKKESNTLYTINALNTLICSLNKGILDKGFVVNWEDYKNCILLTQPEGVRRLNTTIHKVIHLS